MTDKLSAILTTPRPEVVTVDIHDLLMYGKSYEIWWESGYWYIKAMHTATVRRFRGVAGLGNFLNRLGAHLAAQQTVQETQHVPHRPAA